ncbi:hypothetical protein [Arenimonas composti]|uniref:Uncharacterized protein n=1 Tax=Arenimonas composti TR7-09 = DSM 18010 TaxID=1121013 RepID=A0A091BG68_9GAMM|nr:hypothetical protein [Arenimonas composti]KFN49799.1 hypothetical protein P873_09595 [Arenimonas composti TR7-09 = DSM 18010]
MRRHLIPLLFAILVAATGAALAAPASTATTAPPTLHLDGVDYAHRWSGAQNQHEFTPAGQDDLEAWRDMVTVIRHPQARDGEGLAAVANTVLGNYQAAGAAILRTSSVPATPEAPAQHFVAAAFYRPDFAEAAFARFVIIDGVGTVIVRGHREYGDEAAPRLQSWITENGEAVERALMALDGVPQV